MSRIILLLIISAISQCACYPGASTETKGGGAKQEMGSDSIPLLLLGSYMNCQDNYPIDSIRTGLNQGWITCTDGIQELVMRKFNLSKRPQTIRMADFDRKDPKRLVIVEIDSVNSSLLARCVEGIHFFSNPAAYPLWVNLDNRTFDFGKQITRYMHTGVTAITRSSGTVLDRQGIDWYLANIKGYFGPTDIVHISNEVSMLDTCNYGAMKMKFATRTEHMEILKRLNASVIELTGNHNLDVGNTPYLRTLEWYRQNGMRYFGGGANAVEASKPLVLTLKDGNKAAWIGFNELCPLAECTDRKGMGSFRYQTERARTMIDSLKKDPAVKYVIACVQFRESDSYAPVETQRRICKELIDFGADVVLGSQAHQAQYISVYRDKTIFYGLGNFLFDQIHRVGVRQAFFLECHFFKGRIIQYRPIYTFMQPSRQPSIASEEEKKFIQQSILKKENF